MSDEIEPKSSPSPAKGPPGSGIILAPGVRVKQSAIEISFVRSSGPGGQNVNKRSTKAQLRIALHEVPLGERAMRRLRRLAGNSITTADELLIESDETRSQARNRRACMDRLRELVALSVIEPKQRRATKPTKGSVRRRLESKNKRAQTKRLRKPPRENE
jgi:ribosome-associated protein